MIILDFLLLMYLAFIGLPTLSFRFTPISTNDLGLTNKFLVEKY